MQAWSNRELSKARKLVLIKTAAQTIPNFWLSLFLIPESICDEVERKLNACLWGRDGVRGIKWITWKKLCVPKECGGLGLKELRKFNIAMLAKQSWRLLTEANPLVSAVMKARYYPRTELLEAKLGSNPSYMWRGIFSSLEILKKGVRRKIGNGENTLVWGDLWLPDMLHGVVKTTPYEQLKNIKVCSLMTSDGKQWDNEILEDLFHSADCQLTRSIPLSVQVVADTWYWLPDDKGVFTVKSCYRILQGECTDEYSRL